MKKEIMIVGDIHGDFESLNKYINKLSPKVILSVGDFGYWPDIVDFNNIKNDNTEIYFCDGNHEDFNKLLSLENNEIVHNIYYMRRGLILKIEDKNILFMGGAESIDKKFRTPGLSWFSEESITKKDIDSLPDEEIDIVISHCAPIEFDLGFETYREYDNSRYALSILLKKYTPKLWFFGHYHNFRIGQHKDTKWCMLNMINEPGFHIWLDKFI